MPQLFPILLKVEEVATGSVLRKLHSMPGVAEIHLQLGKSPAVLEGTSEEVKSLPKPLQRPPVPEHRFMTRDGRSLRTQNPKNNPVYQALAEALRYAPCHLKVLLVAASKVVDTNMGGISSYMNRMSHFKLVQRTAPGTYRITEKGLKLYFSEASKHSLGKKRKTGKFVDNSSGFRNFLLNALKQALDTDPMGEGVLTYREIRDMLASTGYSDKNIYSMGIRMAGEGLIKIKNGRFNITNAGVAALSNLPLIEAHVEDVDHEEGLTTDVS